MFVNIKVPLILDHRARRILDVLGVDSADNTLGQRVSTFVACNGYDGVLRAANYTSKRLSKETIDDPWAYTVRVYNDNLGRLGFLYALTHLVESGLRSQVDLNLTAAYEDNWYCLPEYYLPKKEIGFFWGDQALQGIRWVTDQEAAGGKRVVTLKNATEFLEQITFGWLVRIVLHGHSTLLRNVLVLSDGKAISFDEAKALLDAAKNARNAVAHNRYLTNEQFKDYSAKLVRLLSLLRFNVKKTLQAVEIARSSIADDAIARYCPS